MTLTQFLILLLVAGICGSIGQAIAGYSRGGCLVSIALGFIGALLGTYLARGVARISQVVDYLFYLIYAFIGLMILLDLLGANRAAGFYRFVNGITRPL